MTTAGPEIRQRRSGPLNTKQYKIWIDVLNTTGWVTVSDLADRHNYTNREVTTAIGRMPTPPIVFDQGAVRFEGTDEERGYYRRVLTADRYAISGDMCKAVFDAMDSEWVTVSILSEKTGIPAVSVSRTLVVIGDKVMKKSVSGGVYYRRTDQLC